MKAIITGISGQDGYFLSQLLLSKGYEVHGIVRRNSSMTQGTVDILPDNIRDKIHIEYGDITDVNFLMDLMHKEKPDEIYHLAAQSFVGYSFQNALSTYDVNIGGTLNICNAVRDSSPDTKLYFAATSELYGQPKETPQNERTPFYPGVLMLCQSWLEYGQLEHIGMRISYSCQMEYSLTMNPRLEVRNLLPGK